MDIFRHFLMKDAAGRDKKTGCASAVVHDLAVMLAALSCAAALCVLLRTVDGGDSYVSMIFLLAVAIISRFTTGYFWGIAASVVGILGVNFAFTAPYFEFCLSIPGYTLSFASMLLVSMITSTLMTRVKSIEKQRYRAQVEEMRVNLLRAVSHDLRTPLTSISGAASVLVQHPEMECSDRERLLKEIIDDSQWLVRMVENLLSITRINAEAANLHKTREAAEEVIAEAVRKFRKRFEQPNVEIKLPDELLLVPMDAILIEQVLTNLLENVVYHAQTATKIRLTLARCGRDAVFEVIDDGAGISPRLMDTLFDESVSRSDDSRSMGIGLSVCRAIIAAHGGSIEAENCAAGGACLRFRLPMGEESYDDDNDDTDR